MFKHKFLFQFLFPCIFIFLILGTLLFSNNAHVTFDTSVIPSSMCIEDSSLQPIHEGSTTISIPKSILKIFVSLRNSSSYLLRELIQFFCFLFNILSIDKSSIISWFIPSTLFCTLLGCSYYFSRLNVLSSQAHPPTS